MTALELKMHVKILNLYEMKSRNSPLSTLVILTSEIHLANNFYIDSVW